MPKGSAVGSGGMVQDTGNSGNPFPQPIGGAGFGGGVNNFSMPNISTMTGLAGGAASLFGGNSPTPGPSQSTTTVNSRADKIASWAMPWAKEFGKGDGIQRPDFSLVQGADPLQTQGQEMTLAATGAQGDIVGTAGRGNQFLAGGDVLNPDSNPALRATIDASTRPIINNLMEAVLPGIRNSAVSTGNFGSSRQGIAEGLATGRAATAVGDTAAKVATAGYNSGLDAMAKGQQYAPLIAQSQTMPGMTTSAVGDVRQNQAQRELTERGQNFNFDQMMPLLMAKELMGLASGTPGGTNVSSASVPQQPSSGMGQAAPYIGMAMQMLPMMMAMSDRRTKEDIEQIGTLFGGLPIYRFKYLFDDYQRIGFMAQDVEKVFPDAVKIMNGVKFVDNMMVVNRTIEMMKEKENV